jgi:hypothetical protein
MNGGRPPFCPFRGTRSGYHPAMKLECNIDSRGKRFRLLAGAACLVGGVVAAALWPPVGGWVAWAVSIAAIAGGAFMIFEARSGWCALRAMGVKTRI